MSIENDLLNKRVIYSSHMYTELEVDNHSYPDMMDNHIMEMLLKGWCKEAAKHLKVESSKDTERGVHVKSVSGVILTPEEYKELVRMATVNKG